MTDYPTMDSDCKGMGFRHACLPAALRSGRSALTLHRTPEQSGYMAAWAATWSLARSVGLLIPSREIAPCAPQLWRLDSKTRLRRPSAWKGRTLLPLVVGLLLAMLGSSTTRAGSTSKNRKVSEMLTLMHMAETTDRLERAQETRIETVSQQQLAGLTLDSDQKKSYDEFRRKMVKLLRKSATWEVLEPDFIRLYSDAYSEAEIDGILTFYRSPIGHTMLERAPDLTEHSIALSQQRMAELTPKIQELTEQFMREMR